MKTIFLKKIALFSIVLLSFVHLQAQPWASKIKSANPTLKEIRDTFYDYWKDKPIEKGKGYKPFKRWEWYWDTRVLKDGTFPKPSITTENLTKYQQTHEGLFNRTTSTANWVSKGPSSSDGGYSGIGRINCIGFHPTIANTFWVGTPAGGLWKTTNGGTSWTTNTDLFPVLGISDIAIDPTNPNTMYVATGDGDAALSTTTLGSTTAGDTKSIGVLKTIDGGNSWSYTGLNWTVTSSKLIRRIIINPTNTQILIAATSDGIWRTTNGGTTWTNVQSGYFIDAEFKPGDPTTVYAATRESGNAKIYRSTTSGGSWTLSATIPSGYRINMAVSAADPTLVDVVVTNSSSGLLGLWYSSNSGASFSQYFTPSASQNMLHNSYNASGIGGQGDYDLAYTINPTNANEIWLGGTNTWKTTNGGSNWTLANFWAPTLSQNPNNVPVVHADKHFLAFHPLVAGTMFECNDGGLYKTTNGGTSWTDLSNGLGISQLYRLSTSATVANSVTAGLQDNGTKGYNGTAWNDLTGGDGMETIIDPTNASIGYASYAKGEIYRTSNQWSNYSTIVNTNGTGVNAEGEWITPYILHPAFNTTILVGKSQVYKSINSGTTWSQLGTITLPIGEKIRHITYAPSNTNIIYVASRTALFKTTDGGITWVSLGTTGTTPISYIFTHPTNANLVYLTLGGYEATDKVYSVNSQLLPATLTNLTGTLPNVPANCIVYQKNTNDALYIGTDVGVFYRNGNMTDWIPYQTNLPNVIVSELEISYINNKLWAATFGRGLWNTDLYTSLPLSLLEFTASLSNKEVQLKWVTTNEVNTKEFEIQKSADGINFITISTLASYNGQSTNNYNTVDKNPFIGNNFYRLKMVDKDNLFTYSPVKNIVLKDKNNSFTVYPNPVKDILRIEFNNLSTRKEISLFDLQGKEIVRKTIEPGLSYYTIKMNHLVNGVYLLQVKTADEITTEKIIVNR